MPSDRKVDSFLAHHGILGQRWGVRRFQNADGSLTQAGRERYGIPPTVKQAMAKTDKGYNLDRLWRDKNHNVLFVTGYSGSGKTTIANELSDNQTDVIHLDGYYDQNRGGGKQTQSNRFNEFLITKVPEMEKIQKNFSEFQEAGLNDYASTKGAYFWKAMDAIAPAIKEYSQTVYPNRKVIVEGIQIFDGAMFPNTEKRKAYFDGQCVITKGTGIVASELRSAVRDGMKPFEEYDSLSQLFRTKYWQFALMHEFEKDLKKKR